MSGLGLIAALVCCHAVAAQAVDAPRPDVVVTDHGVKVHDLPRRRRQSHHELAITCGKATYVLALSDTQHSDAKGQPVRSSATIGIQYLTGGPSRRPGQGWYPNDTFHLFADGVDLNASNGRWRDARILAQGRAALVEATLEHAKACARIRLAYKPGQEGLDVQVIFEPSGRTPAKKFRVRLSCYPAFYTAWNKRRGDRWVVTPRRAVEEVREPGLDMDARQWKSVHRHVDLNPTSEWWLFYYDKFFNSPDGKGKGLCGLVIRPGELRAVGLDVSDYGITTELKLRPDRPVVRFTLWQRNVRDFQQPLGEFPQIAAGTRRRLADKWLFSPPSVVGFDRAGETRALDALVQASPTAAALRDPLKRTSETVERFRAAPIHESLDAEAAADRAIRLYRRAFWQMRRRVPHRRRLLALLGAHFPQWRLDEAVGRSAKAMAVDKSFFAVSWRGDRLTRFPATEQEIMRYDAVVLVNVSVTPLRKTGQELLKTFVAAGGGLVVCGGFYSYSGGLFAGSVFEEMLPVSMTGPNDVKRLAEAAPIVRGDRVPGLPGPSWTHPGVVLWLHDLVAKPGAKVPLYANTAGRKRPFLVLGRFGQGRVAALAGTVYGVPPPGNTPFWDHPEWTGLLASVIAWTCAQDPASGRP